MTSKAREVTTAEAEGAAEPWPKGSFAEWVESELRAGRDPCNRVQDDPEEEDA